MRLMADCSISRCLILLGFGSIEFAPLIGLEQLEEEARILPQQGFGNGRTSAAKRKQETARFNF
jgi:hypothetical protein